MEEEILIQAFLSKRGVVKSYECSMVKCMNNGLIVLSDLQNVQHFYNLSRFALNY